MKEYFKTLAAYRILDDIVSICLHETIQWECLSSSSETLSKKLEVALKDDNVDEAWEAFSSFKRWVGRIHIANTYALLLQAYCEDNKLEESKKHSKQIEKAGLLGTDVNVTCASLETKSHLGEFLEKEIREEQVGSQLIYELNNSILFFCQAKMVEDAMRTFRSMRKRNTRPTMQTFKYLLDGYSSLESYRAITILWGEIKREMEDKDLAADRDLLDCLLLNFLKGGYFERVMEIISYMSKCN
uniref:Pentatricopeptide repeat-containing protein n=1 Tax=Ananas comosus var. bracteatus TaxID=296719 RepID=A0A6V7NK28_ANACO|nr:unnamed protein product [Ananas comosus var. bracteatus]